MSSDANGWSSSLSPPLTEGIRSNLYRLGTKFTVVHLDPYYDYLDPPSYSIYNLSGSILIA